MTYITNEITDLDAKIQSANVRKEEAALSQGVQNRIPAACVQNIENALNALSVALETVDAAEMEGVKIHPSIGNKLYTAKRTVAEALQYAQEISRDSGKNPGLTL